MRYLIAGLGSIGRRHLRNLLALGESDIVLYRTGRSTLPDDELSPFPVEHDFTVALGRFKPDAVVVANPTALHLDVAIPAARAGCALFLEKPVSHSLDRVPELEGAVREGGAPVLVGFQFRFHPLVQRARELVETGAIGRLLSANMVFGEYLPGWHPWEDYRQGYAARSDLGGGVVLTQCHALDYLAWLVGPIASVTAFVAKLSDLELTVDDTAEICLQFRSGALGSLHLDYSRRPAAHRFELIGTRGMVAIDLLGGTAVLKREGGAAADSYGVPSGWERNSMFLDLMRHFVDVADRGAEPACTLASGFEVQRVIHAVLESSASRRAVDVQG